MGGGKGGSGEDGEAGATSLGLSSKNAHFTAFDTYGPSSFIRSSKYQGYSEDTYSEIVI